MYLLIVIVNRQQKHFFFSLFKLIYAHSIKYKYSEVTVSGGPLKGFGQKEDELSFELAIAICDAVCFFTLLYVLEIGCKMFCMVLSKCCIETNRCMSTIISFEKIRFYHHLLQDPIFLSNGFNYTSYLLKQCDDFIRTGIKFTYDAGM